MFKISLTELEEVRRDPKGFRRKKEAAGPFQGGRSIFQVLKRSIYEYHKSMDAVAAINYLEGKLESFKNRARCEKAVGGLQWYIAEHRNRGWATVLRKYNITIPLSTQYWDSLKVSGEINRIDMHPNGTYAAWLFSKGNLGNWIDELRMPIIQNAIGVEMGARPELVHIGLYCFGDHTVNIHNFTDSQIKRAHLELEDLFRNMGF
jgi:hypothetical protein